MIRAVRILAVVALGIEIIASWFLYRSIVAPVPFEYGPNTSLIEYLRGPMPDILVSVAYSLALATGVFVLVFAGQRRRWSWFLPMLVLTVLLAFDGLVYAIAQYMVLVVIRPASLFLPNQPDDGAVNFLRFLPLYIAVALQVPLTLVALAFALRGARPAATPTGTYEPDPEEALTYSSINQPLDAAP